MTSGLGYNLRSLDTTSIVAFETVDEWTKSLGEGLES